MAAFHSKWKYEDLSRRRPCFSDYAETGHFTLLFCTGQLKNVEIYNARAQLIKPFTWRRCCCCRGGGLFKLPIAGKRLHDKELKRKFHQTKGFNEHINCARAL